MSLICSIKWFEKTLVPIILSAEKKGVTIASPSHVLDFVKSSRNFKNFHSEILAFTREVGIREWEETIRDLMVLFKDCVDETGR